MTIPYYVLGLLYLGILGFYFITVFFNLYHLIKFGFFDFTGKINGILFSLAWIVILGFTLFLLKDVPWFDTFDLFKDIIGEISF